ncbi:MAG: polyphosphate polymerase domain-containing protein [Lachnospiraceae bacterium]|nr:polyphosphate polymerase domain-containing protein [Lachnospiraceae bacterium]
MKQEVFKRYEKKYLLTIPQYHTFLGKSKEYLCEDTFGSYSISNIYFDTPDFFLIRNSLEHPRYKEKLRLRCYGEVTPDSPVFLEIKKKYDHIVYKRRTSLTLSEAEAYLYRSLPPKDGNQILREIDWLFARYPLQPAIYLTCNRKAYCGKENSDLRVTFDTNIRGRNEHLFLQDGTDGLSLLPEGMILMEVKIPNAMPLWMCHLFTELSLQHCSFSKYGTYYREYICKEKKGNIKYA